MFTKMPQSVFNEYQHTAFLVVLFHYVLYVKQKMGTQNFFMTNSGSTSNSVSVFSQA